jgi:ankyrin repeat protein
MNFNLEQLNAYLAHRGEHEGDVPLHIAAQEGHVEVAYWLLMEGADCRVANQFGDTPLHYAARWGHAEVARLLVKGGASVKARNGMGWTPLHHAASYGHAELA